MVGSSEPEAARRFGPGKSRRMRARSYIPCVELQAILLLMDERDGVTIARHRGLKVVGTLAALDLAAAHGLVDLQTMFERLRATTFRSPVRLMVSMLEQDAERKKRQEGRQ
jgi:predicted nucleic acid-binding protein